MYVAPLPEIILKKFILKNLKKSNNTSPLEIPSILIILIVRKIIWKKIIAPEEQIIKYKMIGWNFIYSIIKKDKEHNIIYAIRDCHILLFSLLEIRKLGLNKEFIKIAGNKNKYEISNPNK